MKHTFSFRRRWLTMAVFVGALSGALPAQAQSWGASFPQSSGVFGPAPDWGQPRPASKIQPWPAAPQTQFPYPATFLETQKASERSYLTRLDPPPCANCDRYAATQSQ